MDNDTGERIRDAVGTTGAWVEDVVKCLEQIWKVLRGIETSLDRMLGEEASELLEIAVTTANQVSNISSTLDSHLGDVSGVLKGIEGSLDNLVRATEEK